MKYQRENIGDVLYQALPLLYLHWKEIAHYDDIKLDPQTYEYLELEKKGALRCYTARLDSDELVGYAVFFLRYNLHYRSSFQALQDVIFIHPEHRGEGAKFIMWCDEQLKKENVQVVYHHIKSKHNFGPLLERMDYELVDLIYAKRLDK